MYFYLSAHVLVAETGQFDEREEADELLVELLEFRVAAEDERGHFLVLTLHFDYIDLSTTYITLKAYMLDINTCTCI